MYQVACDKNMLKKPNNFICTFFFLCVKTTILRNFLPYGRIKSIDSPALNPRTMVKFMLDELATFKQHAS